jgi:hypothetical protein
MSITSTAPQRRTDSIVHAGKARVAATFFHLSGAIIGGMAKLKLRLRADVGI